MAALVTATRSAIEVLTGRRRIFYGWWILACCVVGLGFVNGISFWSFGLFIQPVEEEFGWSRADVSFGISLSLLVAGLSAPAIGWFVDRRGPRRAILLGTVGTAATYLLLAMTQTLWQWQLFMALNGLARHLIFLIPFMALISRWFDRRRSLAVGIASSGLMVGGMVMVPLMRVVIDWLTWDEAFLFAAGATVAIYLPMALFVIRDHPADLSLTPDGEPARDMRIDPAGEPVQRGLTLAQAARTPLFWTFVAGITLFTFGMATWIVHSVPFYESVGFSPAWAAALTSMSAGLGIGSRLAAGHLADRLPSLEFGAAGVAALLAVSMSVLLVSTSPLAIAIFLPLFVTGFGGGGALMLTLLLTRGFGVAHFATILGAVMVVETAGLLLGPTAAGAIFDATGSYRGAVLMLFGAFALAAVLFLLASRMRRPLEAFEALERDARVRERQERRERSVNRADADERTLPASDLGR